MDFIDLTNISRWYGKHQALRDVSLRLVHRQANDAERQAPDQSGAVSEIALLRAMAVSLDGAHHTLIELKAVDAAYPLYGRVSLNPPLDLATALALREGVYGAVVVEGLIHKGDPIEVLN